MTPRKDVTRMHDSTTAGISLDDAYARNDNARRMVAGFTTAMPALAEAWQQLERALADIPAMGAVITRLSADLAATRMDRANLLAAMRAALGAHADGETDPLSYLRDELEGPQDGAAARGRRS
jgi:hypothetical protein